MKRALLFAGSVVLSATVVELGLRLWLAHLPVSFLLYLSPRLRDASPAVLARLHAEVPALRTRWPDPDTGWTYPPGVTWTGTNEDGEAYSARTSNEGFFTPNQPDKSQQQLILLGDSFLSTYYARRPIPNVIHEALGIPTYNLAVGGWGPESYIAAYRKFATGRHHELVIVGTFLNDITDVDNWNRWKRENGSESFLMWNRHATSKELVNLRQSWPDTQNQRWYNVGSQQFGHGLQFSATNC